MHWSLWVLLAFVVWILVGLVIGPLLSIWLTRARHQQTRPITGRDGDRRPQY
jgi:uncharacterized protein YneF (UPF0154 family)